VIEAEIRQVGRIERIDTAGFFPCPGRLSGCGRATKIRGADVASLVAARGVVESDELDRFDRQADFLANLPPARRCRSLALLDDPAGEHPCPLVGFVGSFHEQYLPVEENDPVGRECAHVHVRRVTPEAR
jgi:hypothetical protein